MITVNAKAVIKSERDPTSDGALVAKHIIKNKIAVDDLTIDVCDLAPEDLVSSFVNALLYALEQSSLLPRGHGLHWKTRFKSEATRLEELVNLYLDADRG